MRLTCNEDIGSSILSPGTKRRVGILVVSQPSKLVKGVRFSYPAPPYSTYMTEKKPSKNPFINLANAAKAVAAGSQVSPDRAAQVQSAIKRRQTGATARPVKKSSGRGR